MEPSEAILLSRLIASLLVRDEPWDRAIARLTALGLPLDEIRIVVGSAGAIAGASQQRTIEQLFELGFDSTAIHELTGIPKTTVQPAVSKLKRAVEPQPKPVPSSVERGSSPMRSKREPS